MARSVGRQRLLLLLFLFGITFLLFRNSHTDTHETARQQFGGGVANNAAAELKLKGLAPANATLGVCNLVIWW